MGEGKVYEFITGEWGSRIAQGCAILAIVVSMVTVCGHLIFYTRPVLQRSVVRVVLIVPVYALGSSLSLVVPKGAPYFNSIRDCYESFVLYTFMSLMIAYGAGEAAIILSIQDNPGHIKHPWPMCCLPAVVLNSKFMRMCKQQIIQFVIVKPVMALATLIMVWRGLEKSALFTWTSLIVYNVSYTLALYYLLLFYMATKIMLAPYDTVKKFLAVKLVVFATYWQSLLVAALPFMTHEEAERLNDWVLSVEMLIFSLIHMSAFSFMAFKALPGSRGSFLKNLWHVISIRDVIQDTVNSFSQKVSRYMLASTFNIDATEHQPPAPTSAAGDGGKSDHGDIESGHSRPAMGAMDDDDDDDLLPVTKSQHTETQARRHSSDDIY